MTTLLPRARPSEVGVSATALLDVLDGLLERGLELHSLMVVRRGYVLAEGWWAPYSPERLHLLYSLSKSFTSTAVGLAVAEGLFGLDDHVVDLLPSHRPDVVDERVAALTVHHLLSMSTGHDQDTIDAMFEATQGHGGDMVETFLSIPPQQPVGSRHVYNNGTTYVLSVLVEEKSGVGLLDYLRPRLLDPLGIDEATWDTDEAGHAYGLTGLHLQTEAVAAFGQLLLQDGVWQGARVLPEGWVTLATRSHIDNDLDPAGDIDWRQGYGYQYWMHRHGYRGDGAFGQFCALVPDQELVIATTAASPDMQGVLDVLWERLLPGLSEAGLSDAETETDDERRLRARLGSLALPAVSVPAGVHAPGTASFTVQDVSPLAPFGHGTRITVEQDGTMVAVETGSASYRISCRADAWAETVLPLLGDPSSGERPTPVVARGGWCTSNEFVADIVLVETPHRIRLSCFDTEASATWQVQPLGPDRLEHYQR